MSTGSARALTVTLLAVLALGACSDDDGGDRATDRSSGGTPSAPPTASPTAGSYPGFAPEDYTYTLSVGCFCPDAGMPIRITVEDGQVTGAVYHAEGKGVAQGSGRDVPDYRRLTIDDIIDEANAATGAHDLQVDWPEGQDHPSRVFIDQSDRIVDEEVGYTISDVELG